MKVHQVGRRAAELTGAVRVLETTIPRDVVARLVRLARIPVRYDPAVLSGAYSPRAAITHRFDVRRFARQKQAALAAHASPVTGGGRLAPVLRILVRAARAEASFIRGPFLNLG